MGTDIYHKAARDGYLDLLQEATRKDADRPDEDGMTPTLWAAFHGNLDALRMLIGRGGNPDKCDLLGNTALHCAAANGHLNCASYLVSFGANLWALDNDLHTPLDVAVLNNHSAIVKYLDERISQQSLLNKKMVRKMKEKSVLEAHKRIKRYEKLQQKAQRKAEKADRVMARERLKMHTGSLVEQNEVGTASSSKGRERQLQQGGGASSSAATPSTSTTKSSSAGRPVSRSASSSGTRGAQPEPKPFSAYVNGTGSKKSGVLTGVAKRIKQQKRHQVEPPSGEFKIGEMEVDGRRTIRSLSGLQRDHHVLYVRNNFNNSQRQGKGGSEDTISRSISEPDFTYAEQNGSSDGLSSSVGPTEAASMFERPGFGSVAFINRHITSNTLLSLPPSDSTDIDSVSVVTNGIADNSEPAITNGRVRRKGSFTDSIGTVGSLAVRMRNMPWAEVDIGSDDEPEASPLELFLTANGLSEYLHIFTREKIDLSALLLLSDADMKEIGLPMGPRRKLLDAIARRKKTMQNPGIVMDTLL